MRKTLFTLSIAAALMAGQAPVLAADTDLTAQQKFDALAAKGIFAGIDGQAALDQNMNRAQFARVAALILGLDGIGNPDTRVVTEKPFSDVALGTWYSEEIAAAKQAGILVGNTDSTFNPRGDVSVQELAVIVAKQLGLNPVEGARVDGAADWAAGYIRAVQNAGITFPSNYTEPATRQQLTSLAFTADPQAKIPTQAEIAAQVITDAVKANPDQATSIVADAIKADPSQAALIVQAAVSAAPDQAGAITKAAIGAAPEQEATITQAATDAAPQEAEAIQAAAAGLKAVAPTNTLAAPTNSTIPNASSSGGGSNGNPIASPSTVAGPNPI
jgi:hypothetical protein